MRVAISFGAAASFSFTARTAAASLSVGKLAAHAALEFGALVRRQRREALLPGLCARPCARCPAARQASSTSAGISNGGSRPAELLARALDLVGAERRAVRTSRCRPWSARRSRWWCGRRSWSAGRRSCACSIAAAMASGSWPSMRRRRPAGGLEALHLVDRVGERQRAVDGDAVVVEQHDQLVELQVAGERDRLLADAFHQVAVGGEHVGAVVDDVVAELGGEMRARRSPCRPRWRGPGRAGRWWSRRPA